MSDSINLVIEEVDLLLAEAARMQARGPHLIIIHRWQELDGHCLPGEEIAAARVMFRGREFDLDLGLGPLILLDYLARFRWLPQRASQVAAALNADTFCLQHGANAPRSRKQTRKFTHGAVKVYAGRIRNAMAVAFEEAGITLDPFVVLASEPGYRLNASVEWIHLSKQGFRSISSSRKVG